MNKEFLNSIGKLKEHKDCLCSLEDTSKDSEKQECMTISKMIVINFDSLKNQRSKSLKIPNPPASTDALYIAHDKSTYLIEFKNGRIAEKEKTNIINKIHDSIILLFDRNIINDLQECINRLYFILVYNNEKFTKEQTATPSRVSYENHVCGLAKTNPIFKFIDKFKGHIFNDVYAYSKEEFQENFVSKYDR